MQKKKEKLVLDWKSHPSPFAEFFLGRFLSCDGGFSHSKTSQHTKVGRVDAFLAARKVFFFFPFPLILTCINRRGESSLGHSVCPALDQGEKMLHHRVLCTRSIAWVTAAAAAVATACHSFRAWGHHSTFFFPWPSYRWKTHVTSFLSLAQVRRSYSNDVTAGLTLWEKQRLRHQVRKNRTSQRAHVFFSLSLCLCARFAFAHINRTVTHLFFSELRDQFGSLDRTAAGMASK